MRGRGVRWFVVSAFALALGHLCWHAQVGPALPPRYTAQQEGVVLAAPDPEAKQVYLRHPLYLSQRPLHAWIQILGRDQLQLLVNGRHVDQAAQDGFEVAIVADLA